MTLKLENQGLNYAKVQCLDLLHHLNIARNEKQCMQPITKVLDAVLFDLSTNGDLPKEVNKNDMSFIIRWYGVTLYHFHFFTEIKANPKLVIINQFADPYFHLDEKIVSGAIFNVEFCVQENIPTAIKNSQRVFPEILLTSLLSMSQMESADIFKCIDAKEGYDYSMDSLFISRDVFIPVRVSVTNKYLKQFMSGVIENECKNQKHIKMEFFIPNDTIWHYGYTLGYSNDNQMIYRLIKYFILRGVNGGFGYQNTPRDFGNYR